MQMSTVLKKSHCQILIVSCSELFLEALVKKLDNGVSVPFVDAQRFHYVPLVVEELDERVRPARVPHFQAWKSARQIAFHKGCKQQIKR